ncbi:LOW QUALITY PROTEIN: cGMP-dependent protein kinase 2 [Phalacrocorax aristotelis]|uniref:LOW QUALITY PROTEIN: cGMP-dependent protein kinase 2 n=1 Tax=Phalacrocorax aristotelis TaxID=126867 RepID=UPI003F4B3C17
MGNGSVKPKHLRQLDRHVANPPNGCAGNHKCLKDPGLGINVINQADVLCGRVPVMEKELKRKDQELQEGQNHVAELQEQLVMQTKVIAELTKELQSKCIQLNKLQDVVSTQGEHFLQPSPFKVTSRIQISADRKRGAKEGVSAEPTTRLYDLNRQAVFSLETGRVQKDSSEKNFITDALKKNQFLKRLEPHQIRDMVECMYERTFQQGSYIIRQGEPGNHIFVLKESNLEVFAGNHSDAVCALKSFMLALLRTTKILSVTFMKQMLLSFSSPPFSGAGQMMTYGLILKGIEKLDFPKIITGHSADLIRRLCRQNPTERLGNLRNGINNIKKHSLSGPTDYSYFDSYPPEEGTPPGELSGWDKDF